MSDYWYLVESDSEVVNPMKPQKSRLYEGTDVADAMAAFSKGISDEGEYVTIEALIKPS